MKKAIIYSRVSTSEQKEKGYSLKDQVRSLIEYCKKNNIQIIKSFVEDHSAKDFNRPIFNELHQFAEEHKDEIDYLLVKKWDRFSRNHTQSYRYIELFEKLNIKVNSISEWLDDSNHVNIMLKAIHLALPEIENKIRSDRTRIGIRASLMEGRSCFNAPTGYIRGKDANNKPLMFIDTEIAPDILHLFEDFATGNYSQVELVKKYRSNKLILNKAKLSKMLRNSFYAGEIEIKATATEPEQIVIGLHEPIVSKEVFDNVQRILNGNRPLSNNKSSYEQYLPLRGELLCDKCNKPLTGTTKTKKNGKLYSYYHGNSNYNCKCKVSASELHQQIEELLIQLEPKPEIKELILEMIKSKSKTAVDNKKKKTQSIEKAIKLLEDKKDKLFEKFIEDDINKEVYDRYNSKYTDEIQLKTEEILILKEEFENIEDHLQNTLEYFDNLSTLYVSANPKGKRTIISSILEEKLRIRDKKYRTPVFKDIVKLICRDSKAFRDVKNKKGNSSQEELPRVRTERLELSQA
ncbi:MAG: recombinase family protein [Candidatus Kapaibacterium sp.]